jgi:hypothetical protein
MRFLITSLNTINFLVFVKVTQCLICEARIEIYSAQSTDKGPRNRGSFLNKGKKYLSFSKCPDRLWELSSQTVREFFPPG